MSIKRVPKIPIVERHFRGIHLDLRKRDQGYERYMDQKVTPDVLSFIADCILNLADTRQFTIKDIWESEYFVKNIQTYFTKPSPRDKKTANEYDKFISQSINALAYARAVEKRRGAGRSHLHNMINRELMEHIATNDRCAFGFIIAYVFKVLKDSGFLREFEKFQTDPSKQNYAELKEKFEKFMLGNTKITKRTEVRRIFPKVINPLAVKFGLPGSEKGRISKHPFTFSGLMYNRSNFRDIGKDKRQTRKEHAGSRAPDPAADYRIVKAVKIIKEKYAMSELKDQWAGEKAIHVHHIFPRSDYPQFAGHTENLIKLTAEQHSNRAHPGGKTGQTDRSYQIECLLAKCNSIEESLGQGEEIYSLQGFVELLNACLNLDIPPNSCLGTIRERLREQLTMP